MATPPWVMTRRSDWMLAAFGLGLTAAGTWAFGVRRTFIAKLDTLERRVTAPGPPSSARTDLPPEVLALATRLGARAEPARRYVALSQTGSMWSAPGAAPMRFKARQVIATDAPGFVWRASFSPFGLIMGADAFVDGRGELDIRALGLVSLARQAGTASVDRGEVLRYLAELPWNPDAILLNRALDWTVEGPRTISVATGQGAARAVFTFDLDAEGRIAGGHAAARDYVVGHRTETRPWRGRFWDYQTVEGRLIPLQGEVAWVLDAGDFVYWRGEILTWTAGG